MLTLPLDTERLLAIFVARQCGQRGGRDCGSFEKRSNKLCVRGVERTVNRDQFHEYN